jgi:hypothetical protein
MGATLAHSTCPKSHLYRHPLANERGRGGLPSSFHRYPTKRGLYAFGNIEGLASEPWVTELGLIVTTMLPSYTKFENFIRNQT